MVKNGENRHKYNLLLISASQRYSSYH